MKLQKIIDDFNEIRDQNPIIFLDYDGTLVPIITEPEKSFPDEELLEILNSIQEKYEMYLVTGRSLAEMNTFVGNRYNLVALHGAVISRKSGQEETVDNYKQYREKCDRIFNMKDNFQRRFPGVHLINKDGGVVFTKWRLDPGLHQILDEEICQLSEEIGMSCYIGKMIVEIRIPGPNKGTAISNIRKGRPAVIAGDDKTDEDAFQSNSDAFTIKIGDGFSKARYRVRDYLEFRKFLVALKS